MAAAAILKNHKNCDISRSGLTDFYEIWYADAKWALGLLTSPTANNNNNNNDRLTAFDPGQPG